MSTPRRITSPSSGSAGVQWPGLKAGRGRPVLAASALALALATIGCGKKTDTATGGRPTPSGLPVPRYVSLKFNTVNARGGPGDDHRLLWVYHVRSLPVQVVAETDDWRRVCDPEGNLAWVHKRTVDSHRYVMRTEPEALALRKSASETAPGAGALVGRSLAELDKCSEGWCRISARGVKGWVKIGEVWGAAEAPQCQTGVRTAPPPSAAPASAPGPVETPPAVV